MSLGRDLAMLVCPARCSVCRAATPADQAFCSACARGLPWWRRVDGCPVCGATAWPDAALDRACGPCLARGSALHRGLALCRYEGEIARLLLAFKRNTRPFGPPVPVARAVDALSVELARLARARWPQRPDAVVGIPIHPLRRLRRGFNQVDPVARRVARTLEIRWAPGWLRRTHRTPRQVGRGARDRARNMAGAFTAGRALPRDARIWLVDDVLTTGATLETAADALLEAGALEVRALTLAATLPPARRRETRRGRSPADRAAAAPAPYAPAPPDGRIGHDGPTGRR